MRKLFLLLLLSSVGYRAFLQQNDSPRPIFSFLRHYPNVRDFALSSNGDEAYFTVQSPLEELGLIVCSRKINGRWATPALSNFAGRYRDIEPFLTKDGLRLYFSSNRPLNDSAQEAKDYDIWYVERRSLAQAWSKPVNLGGPVNTAANEFYPSFADNGNLYFTSDGFDSKGKDNIYASEWKGGRLATPYSLDSNINTDGYEFNAFVAPDESFLIYTGYTRKDGKGSGDLYISFKNNQGQWMPSKNVGGKVNSKQMDYCPFVDMKSRTLYFTSRRSDFPVKKFRSLKQYLTGIDQYENGLSRIYKISMMEVLPR